MELMETIATTKQKGISFSGVLFFWIFASLLPQFLQLTREDTLGTILKMGLILILLAVTMFDCRGKKVKIRKDQLIILILFLILQIISNFLVNEGSGFSTYVSLGCSLLYYYVFCCQYGNETLSREQILNIAKKFEYLLLYVCIMNIVLYGPQIIPMLKTFNANAYSIDSVFFNRTNYASFLLICVIMIYYRLYLKCGNRVILWLLIVLGAFNMILTLARTSIFSAVLFFIIIFLYKKKNELFKHLFILLSATLIAILILEATGGMRYIIDVIIRPQAGLTHRDLIWARLFVAFQNASVLQILFGFGYNFGIEAHNTVLGTMEKFGILGSILYLIIYLQTFKSILVVWKRDRATGMFLLCTFLTFWITSFTEEFTPFMSTSMSTIWTFSILLPRYYANYLERMKND